MLRRSTDWSVVGRNGLPDDRDNEPLECRACATASPTFEWSCCAWLHFVDKAPDESRWKSLEIRCRGRCTPRIGHGRRRQTGKLADLRCLRRRTPRPTGRRGARRSPARKAGWRICSHTRMNGNPPPSGQIRADVIGTAVEQQGRGAQHPRARKAVIVGTGDPRATSIPPDVRSAPHRGRLWLGGHALVGPGRERGTGGDGGRRSLWGLANQTGEFGSVSKAGLIKIRYGYYPEWPSAPGGPVFDKAGAGRLVRPRLAERDFGRHSRGRACFDETRRSFAANEHGDVDPYASAVPQRLQRQIPPEQLHQRRPGRRRRIRHERRGADLGHLRRR